MTKIPLQKLLSMMDLLIGYSTLRLFLLADNPLDGFDDHYSYAEAFLNVLSSVLAMIIGTVSLISYLSSKPDTPLDSLPLEDSTANASNQLLINDHDRLMTML